MHIKTHVDLITDLKFVKIQHCPSLECFWTSIKCWTLCRAPRTLHWRHNDHDGVSNHQPHGCLLNCLFRRRSNNTSKLRVTGLCVGNSPGPVNSPHKGPVTLKMFPFDDVIMNLMHTVMPGRPGWAMFMRGRSLLAILWIWWRHQMEIFSTSLAICAGNSPVTGEFPAQRPVTGSFDVFFDLRVIKRLSNQSWGWWFETPSRPLWPHCKYIWQWWHEQPSPNFVRHDLWL